MSRETPFSRGGVWRAEIAGKRRPVVIVTHAALCPVLARLAVAGVTTTRRGVETEVEVGAHNGVAEGSVVNALDLATLPTEALRGYRGELDPAQLRQLDGALRLALGLELWSRPRRDRPVTLPHPSEGR